MLSSDKDQKLSQLLQLKKSFERPNQKFWGTFDAQLQKKLKQQLEQQTLEAEVSNRSQKISLRSLWCYVFGKYKFYTQALAYALGCTAFFAIMHRSIHNVQSPQHFPGASMAMDVIPFQAEWTDVTLAFSDPKVDQIHYVCDDMHISILSSRTKELTF